MKNFTLSHPPPARNSPPIPTLVPSPAWTRNNPNNRGFTGLICANFRVTSRNNPNFVPHKSTLLPQYSKTPPLHFGHHSNTPALPFPLALRLCVCVVSPPPHIGSKLRLAPAGVRPSFLLSAFHGFLI